MLCSANIQEIVRINRLWIHVQFHPDFAKNAPLNTTTPLNKGGGSPNIYMSEPRPREYIFFRFFFWKHFPAEASHLLLNVWLLACGHTHVI